MNRLAGMFRLTRSEQRVVVILVLALLAVALLTRSREMPAPPVAADSGTIDYTRSRGFGLRFFQTGNGTVANKQRTQFRILVRFRFRQFEIENADAKPLNAVERAAIACARP